MPTAYQNIEPKGYESNTNKCGYHDLKRLPPHSTGKPCAVKVARMVWRDKGSANLPRTLHHRLVRVLMFNRVSLSDLNNLSTLRVVIAETSSGSMLSLWV